MTWYELYQTHILVGVLLLILALFVASDRFDDWTFKKR